jgi:hypothetical protein
MKIEAIISRFALRASLQPSAERRPLSARLFLARVNACPSRECPIPLLMERLSASDESPFPFDGTPPLPMERSIPSNDALSASNGTSHPASDGLPTTLPMNADSACDECPVPLLMERPISLAMERPFRFQGLPIPLHYACGGTPFLLSMDGPFRFWGTPGPFRWRSLVGCEACFAGWFELVVGFPVDGGGGGEGLPAEVHAEAV